LKSYKNTPCSSLAAAARVAVTAAGGVDT